MFLLAVGIEMVLDELLAEVGVALLLCLHLPGVATQPVQVLTRDMIVAANSGCVFLWGEMLTIMT